MIDISREITEDMLVYKNYEIKKPKVNIRNDYERNDFYETSITIDLHSGTHIDAPLHMLEAGADMNYLVLSKVNRLVKVIDLKELTTNITKNVLEKYNIRKGDFLLFKTRNSFEDFFNPNFIGLSPDGAKYLAEIGIDGVGIDGLSVESNNKEHEAHKHLLKKEIIIIEGLDLSKVIEDEYKMICLPIKILKYEAAPCRVILEEKNI